MIRRSVGLLTLLALVACESTPEPPPTRGPTETPGAIIERFLAARRDGNARVAWDCFAGRPQGKRIYQIDDPGRAYRTYEQFQADLARGWDIPELAPATVWKQTGTWANEFGVTFVFEQGTAGAPNRGSLEIRVRPVDDGWMLEAVGAR